MKRTVLLALALLPLLSQGQTAFSFFGGPQVTSAHYTANGKKQETAHKYGFMAGAGWKIPFEVKLSFAPEIFYSLKGYKVTFNQFLFPPGVEAKDNNTTIHTIETAGLLQLDFGDQPSHFFLKAGISLDFQIFGRERFNTFSDSSVDRKMKYDFGVYGHYASNGIIEIGYESAGGFFVAARYTHGLANINNADLGPVIRHRAYGVFLGFYLKKNKIVIDTRNRE